MKIVQKNIKIKELFNEYSDNGENGVIAFGGKLNVRPAYQREFVYSDKKRDEVIRTILRGYPLNVMYWAEGEKDTFELLDGQQRTISICQFLNGDFSLDEKYFHSFTDDQKEKILNYDLNIFQCLEGTESEKLDWFKIINIAGEKLTEQELRNAVFTGTWLTDAKKYFSKNNCVAYQKASDYMSGSPIRQEYLETVLSWINNDKIDEYMSKHQKDENAYELWSYFQEVIDWVERTFISKRTKLMKGLQWGRIFNENKDKKFNAINIEEKIKKLIDDEEVQNQKGIYEYVLTGDEKLLGLRTFPDNIKRSVYEQQNGVCKTCGKKFELEQMHGDHIISWSKGGKTIRENCQMLCAKCNWEKSNK